MLRRLLLVLEVVTADEVDEEDQQERKKADQPEVRLDERPGLSVVAGDKSEPDWDGDEPAYH
jgi:hypothetical protein